eukprot:SAG31_NODE_4409_length_3255_cov_1.603612_3_plen_178_part_00
MSGPTLVTDFSAIPDSDDFAYHRQVRKSGIERHRNLWMHHVGIAANDHVGLFKNDFVKGEGINTAFMSIRSAVHLHGARDQRPAFLRLDVEGHEFTLLDQLITIGVPNLSIDFHAWGHTVIKRALIKLHVAGYDVLSGLDYRTTEGGRSMIRLGFYLLPNSTSVDAKAVSNGTNSSA